MFESVKEEAAFWLGVSARIREGALVGAIMQTHGVQTAYGRSILHRLEEAQGRYDLVGALAVADELENDWVVT